MCTGRNDVIDDIRQYGSLESFQDFPMPENTAFCPALSVHGNTLYMFCHEVATCPVILKFTAEQGQAAGGTGRWVKVTDVPHEVHRYCAMHATSSAITLLGGVDQSHSSTKHISMFSFADKQWTSSTHRLVRSLSPLPGRSADASIVQCDGSLYIVGGGAGVFFQQDAGGKWMRASGPRDADLQCCVACTLSEDCIAIVGYFTAIIHNVVTQEVHQLPPFDISVHSPSLSLFNDCLVCTIGKYVWKLHLNV